MPELHAAKPSSVAASKLKQSTVTSESPRHVQITSFGFDFGIPQAAGATLTSPQPSKPIPWFTDHAGSWLYDTRRDLRNPYVIPDLKKLTGLDPEVQAFLEDCPHAMKRLDALVTQISVYLYFQQSYIWIGCRRGKHRSVAVGEMLFKRFRESYGAEHPTLQFHLAHRDIDRVFSKQPAATPDPA